MIYVRISVDICSVSNKIVGVPGEHMTVPNWEGRIYFVLIDERFIVRISVVEQMYTIRIDTWWKTTQSIRYHLNMLK